MKAKTDAKQRKLVGKPFQPGQCGNPNGRPRTAKFSDAMRQLLKEAGPNGETTAEALAAMCVKKAMKGSSRHIELALNYAEGKPKQGIEVSGPDGSPLQFADFTIEQLYDRGFQMISTILADPLHPVGLRIRTLLAKEARREQSQAIAPGNPLSALPGARNEAKAHSTIIAEKTGISKRPTSVPVAALPEPSEPEKSPFEGVNIQAQETLLRNMQRNRYLTNPGGK